MRKKRSPPQVDMLTAAAQSIGATLGKLAVAAGLNKPPSMDPKPIKRRAKAVAKKTVAVKKRTAKKAATGKRASKAK